MKNNSDDEPQATVVVVWYRPEQWQRVRDISTDSEVFEDNFAEWLQLAEQKVRELQSEGVRVERVEVDSEDLIRWCNEQGRENNGAARTLYAIEKQAALDEKRALFQQKP